MYGVRITDVKAWQWILMLTIGTTTVCIEYEGICASGTCIFVVVKAMHTRTVEYYKAVF